MTTHPTVSALDKAIARLLADALRYSAREGIALTTVSKRIFDDARVLPSMTYGNERITVARVRRAALRLQELKENP